METSAIKTIRTFDIGNNFTQKELRRKLKLITNQSPGNNIIIKLKDECDNTIAELGADKS
jgi:hypothetical protein